MLDSKFINNIMLCDCIEGMRQLPDNCIPLTLTSPPFDDVRDYGGHPFEFEQIADELWRITAEGGVVLWNVQDAIVNGSETGTASKQRLYFRQIGFRLHHTMVLLPKGNRSAAGVRYGPSLQYVLVLSKGRPRSINLIKDIPNKTAGRFRNFSMRKKDGKVEKQKRGIVPAFRSRPPVWEYVAGNGTTTKDQFAFDHPALMPEQVASDLIVSYSRPGDLVFDPMCGAATTCKMALLNSRRYLGMEIFADYYKLSLRRMEAARAELRQRLDDFLDAG